ncbi:MAG: toxin-antitoxin system TumE family protein [Candidatus Baldrarchaeia archaeon]
MIIRRYPDIVIKAEFVDGKLRIFLVDGSFLDIWISRRIKERYAIHWERRHVDGTIYRWDNTPHDVHKSISTFPHHFHEFRDEDVKESEPPASIEEIAIRALEYAKKKLKEMTK